MLKTCLIAAFALVGIAHAQETPVEVKARVIVDGKVVGFEGQGPVALDRRLYVPMRGVLERIGATVTYDAASRTVTASANERSITLPLEGSQGVVDGRSMRFAERPIVMNDRVLVPLRLLSEALGASVEWSAKDMTVKITRGTGEPIDEFVTEGTCARPMQVQDRVKH
ncbi:MAG: copper amine oxidase N-terminal domain-containing protein [Fimbriimonas sp.]